MNERAERINGWAAMLGVVAAIAVVTAFGAHDVPRNPSTERATNDLNIKGEHDAPLL